MKHVFTILAMASTLLLVACNKTRNANVASTAVQPAELDVNVEVENGELVLMINGEEQVIDISKMIGNLDLENIDGEMCISIMAMIDEENDEPIHEFKMMGGHGGSPGDMEEMHEYMLQMMGNRGGSMRARGMKGGHGEPPEGMEGIHERMMNKSRGERGEWRHEREPGEHGDRGVPEVIEFMEELGMFGEVAQHLWDGDSVAMMGIHMIRDQLEGEVRMAALSSIIADAPAGVPARNAALIVAIQIQQEEGNGKEAAELMVELVLSN